MKFKVGDRVKIKKGSNFADQNSGIGKVVSKSSFSEWLEVRFEDGYENSYLANDLIKYSRTSNKTMAKYLLIDLISESVVREVFDSKEEALEWIEKNDDWNDEDARVIEVGDIYEVKSNKIQLKKTDDLS